MSKRQKNGHGKNKPKSDKMANKKPRVAENGQEKVPRGNMTTSKPSGRCLFGHFGLQLQTNSHKAEKQHEVDRHGDNNQPRNGDEKTRSGKAREIAGKQQKLRENHRKITAMPTRHAGRLVKYEEKEHARLPSAHAGAVVLNATLSIYIQYCD